MAVRIVPPPSPSLDVPADRGRVRRPSIPARTELSRGVRQPFDRRELERHGWRTTIEYRENLVRSFSGRLLHVDAEWRAEAERVDAAGHVSVVQSVGKTPAAAWSRLRTEADLNDVHRRRAASQGR